jgi:hypothetical protein
MLDEEPGQLISKGAPRFVNALPWRKEDSFALRHLVDEEVPPKDVMRVSKLLLDRFGFEDGSLGGFGSRCSIGHWVRLGKRG